VQWSDGLHEHRNPVNEKEILQAYQASLAQVRETHAEEARLAQEVVGRISGLQRRAKVGLYPTDAQRVSLSQANDALNKAELKANEAIISFANHYLE